MTGRTVAPEREKRALPVEGAVGSAFFSVDRAPWRANHSRQGLQRFQDLPSPLPPSRVRRSGRGSPPANEPKIKFSNIVQTRRNLESIVVYGTGNRLEPMQTRTARVSRIRKLHLWGSPRAANGQKRPKCESAPASHGRGGGFFRRRIGCRHGGDGCHRCRHSKPLDWSRGRPPRNRRGCRLRPTMSR